MLSQHDAVDLDNQGDLSGGDVSLMYTAHTFPRSYGETTGCKVRACTYAPVRVCTTYLGR